MYACYLFHRALALILLLLGEAAVSILLGLDLGRRLVTDAEGCDEVLVSLNVLAEEEVQKAAALVDERDEAPSGGEVLGVGPQVLGEVGNALGHAGDLVFGASAVGVVSAVLSSQLEETLLVEEAVEGVVGDVIVGGNVGRLVVEVAGVNDDVLYLLFYIFDG